MLSINLTHLSSLKGAMSAAEDMFGLATFSKVTEASTNRSKRLGPLLQTPARRICRARASTFKDYLKYKVSALVISVAFLHITYLGTKIIGLFSLLPSDVKYRESVLSFSAGELFRHQGKICLWRDYI